MDLSRDYSKLPPIEYATPAKEVEAWLWANALRLKNESPVEIEYLARNSLSRISGGLTIKIIMDVVIDKFRDIQTWTTKETREYPTTEKIHCLNSYSHCIDVQEQWTAVTKYLIEGKDWAA